MDRQHYILIPQESLFTLLADLEALSDTTNDLRRRVESVAFPQRQNHYGHSGPRPLLTPIGHYIYVPPSGPIRPLSPDRFPASHMHHDPFDNPGWDSGHGGFYPRSPAAAPDVRMDNIESSRERDEHRHGPFANDNWDPRQDRFTPPSPAPARDVRMHGLGYVRESDGQGHRPFVNASRGLRQDRSFTLSSPAPAQDVSSMQDVRYARESYEHRHKSFVNISWRPRQDRFTPPSPAPAQDVRMHGVGYIGEGEGQGVRFRGGHPRLKSSKHGVPNVAREAPVRVGPVRDVGGREDEDGEGETRDMVGRSKEGTI